MIRARRPAAGLALAGALLGVTGCATSVDPIERLGRKAAVELRELRELRELPEPRDPGDLGDLKQARERDPGRNDPAWNHPVRGAVLVPAS
ncbi:hypothetical protein ACFYV5_16930 [Streptomyces sp. NPDC003035]|uniref:hypothetical protein n=1 Tax=Streptomyces sp. NPDC003035 TaxID=3364676 RepID=UPI00367E6694